MIFRVKSAKCQHWKQFLFIYLLPTNIYFRDTLKSLHCIEKVTSSLDLVQNIHTTNSRVTQPFGTKFSRATLYLYYDEIKFSLDENVQYNIMTRNIRVEFCEKTGRLFAKGNRWAKLRKS